MWRSKVRVRYITDSQSLLTHFESICIVCILDLVSRGEWSVRILLNNEKCCCWIHFFLQVTQSYVFHIQKMRKRPLDITEVYWRSYSVIKGWLSIFRGERRQVRWSKWNYVVYSTFSGVNVYFFNDVTRQWLRIAHCQDISLKVIKCEKQKVWTKTVHKLL